MGEGSAIRGHSGQPLASRGARESLPLRVAMQREIDPIQISDARFDPRDLAMSSFVILFFSLVFITPLILIGAVAKGLLR